MNQTEHPVHEIIAAHLNECKKNVDKDLFGKAITAIKDAKYADPQNIYLIALEKQVKLISDLDKTNPTATSYKNEIKGTLPEIAKRAIEDARIRGEGGSAADADAAGANPYQREHDLALKKLKNQFIQLAEEFIDDGDYEGALEEIRRIFIIDPENVIAKDLENKIENLLECTKKAEPEQKPPRKKRRWGFKRVAPPLVAILLVGNILVLYFTSSVSKNDSEILNNNNTAASGFMIPGRPVNTNDMPLGPPMTEQIRAAIEEIRKIEEGAEGVPESAPADGSDDPLYIAVGVYFEGDISGPATEYGGMTDSSMSTAVVFTDEDAVFTEEIADGESIPRASAADESAAETLPAPISDITAAEDSAEPTPRALVLVDEPAAVSYLETPVYPAMAVEREIEGDVVVRVLVDSGGNVAVTFVERSDHPLLTDSALESARLTRFSPSEPGSTGESRWVSIPYRYRIDR